VKPFILTGYRPLLTEWRRVLPSLFYLHNESGNIYTHLGAFVAFAGAMMWHFGWSDMEMSAADAVVHFLFFAGAMTCFAASATFHLHACNTLDAFRYFHACDYVGVATCILGSFYIALWVGFPCAPIARTLYMVTITALAVPLAVCCVHRHTRENRPLIVSLFVAVVAFGVVPTVHWATATPGPAKIALLQGIVGMFAMYIVGVVIYLTHIPERFFPGRFDFFLHSHQIWHVCVFLAALSEYLGALHAIRCQTACPLAP